MRVVFFGTSRFAAAPLAALAERHEVVACVTRPDKQKGRSLKVLPGYIKSKAKSLGIPVHQPQDIKEESFLRLLVSYNPDFFVVVDFGMMLPLGLLDMPVFCSLNIHPSILPKYRGAAPINWALIKGEKETGVTVIRMNESLDAGDIVLQRPVKIGERETSEDLEARLATLGSELLLEAMELIEKGEAEFRKQDEGSVVMAPKLKKTDGYLDWHQGARSLENRIRGVLPWPGAYTFLNNKMLKVFRARALEGEENGMPAGSVIYADSQKGLAVKAGDGLLLVEEVQMEGKKRMDSRAFLRGRGVKPGTKLGKN